ncbi:MAG: DUF6796 family protein [Chitinophagales bacterium]|nr:DUF6796 family protein [Chitinophagales bacterium]
MQALPKIIYQLTKLAIVAAFIGAVADVLLLYNPEGGYENGDYFFLTQISNFRLLAGHYIGIFFIPLAMMGLLHVYHCLKPAGVTLAAGICMATLYLGYPGVVFHGTVAFTANFLKLMINGDTNINSLMPYIRMLSDPLAIFMPLAFMTVSGLFVYTVIRRQTRYKRWMLFCNPLTFYSIFLVSYIVVPPVGEILLPAGFNLSFGLFFLCSLAAEKKADYTTLAYSS